MQHPMEEYTLDLSFPSLPSTVANVKSFIGSGKTDPTPLIRIVERDPSVSVNVLRRANSAYYGLRREVESIDHAVRLLGFIEICAITMIEGMDQMRDRFTKHPRIFRGILQEAVFTGRFAHQLTQALGLPSEWTRLSFSSGFVYVMGRLVLLHGAPTRYAKLVDEESTPLPDADGELRAFGASHRELAPRASDHWGLPDRITAVLRVAEDPLGTEKGPQKTLADALRVGSRLARQDMASEPFQPPENPEEIGAGCTSDLVVQVAEDASAYAAQVGHP